MSIFAGSRFEGETPLRDEQGRDYFGRTVPPPQTTEYLVYFTSEGDRAESLAARFLDDPTRWWEIADINPEVQDFESFEPNTRLRIPRAQPR